MPTISMTNCNDTPSGGQITEADLRKHWPGCTGPCDQGRRLCPCPAACQTHVSDEPDPPRAPMTRADRIAMAVFAGGLVLALACAVASLT